MSMENGQGEIIVYQATDLMDSYMIENLPVKVFIQD